MPTGKEKRMLSFLPASHHSQSSYSNNNYNPSQLSTGNISSPTMMPQYQSQNPEQTGASQHSYIPQQQQQPYYVLEDGSSAYNSSVTYGNLNSTGGNLNLMDPNSAHQQQFKPKTFSNVYGNTTFDPQYYPSVGQLQQSQQLLQAQSQQLRHQHPASYHLQQAASSNAYALMDSKKKRKRRKFHEIDRLYKCNYQNCDKSYGTLNHLNAHVQLQVHGAKRLPSEFKQIREQCKAKKKQMKIEAELNRNKLYQSQSMFGNVSAPSHLAPGNGYYPVFPPASSIEAAGAPIHSTYPSLQTTTHGSTGYPGPDVPYSSGAPLWTKSKPSSAPNILQPEDVTQQQSTPNSIITPQQQSPYTSSVDPYAGYSKKSIHGPITEPKSSRNTTTAYSNGLVGSSMSLGGSSYVTNSSTSTLGYK